MNAFLSANITSTLPLFAGSHDALFRIFRTIRQAAMGSASSIVSLVMGIACLIIVIKLIKLTYDMESDEQAAGFGGVTLWQICRPVVILFALTIYPTLLGTIDGVADSLTTGIVKMAENQDVRSRMGAMISVIEAATDEDKSQQEVNEIVEQKAEEVGEVMKIDGLGSTAPLAYGVFNLFTKSAARAAREGADMIIEMKADEMTETELNAKEQRLRRKNLARAIAAYYKIDDLSNADGFKFDQPATWIPALCKIIYDFGFIIIECGAEIILCILCFAGPVVLTVSLVDSYKHAFMEFIMRYFQFSFWKVAAAIINWAVESAQIGATAVGKVMAKEDMYAVLSSTSDNGAKLVGSASAAMWVIALISLAGIFCFTKIGELAAYFIPVNGGGMSSGAGAALAAGAGAAAGAASGARTIAGGVSSAASHHSARQQGDQMQQIAQGVASISKSMEGSRVSQGD